MKQRIVAFGAQMKKQNMSAHAAGTAFFLFLSMVPMLMAVSMVLPYTPLTQENLVEELSGLVPDIITPLVTTLIAEVYHQSARVLPVAILTMLWSAGKGMLALMRGLNAICEIEERRNYVVIRLIASLYTVLLLLAFVFSLLIVVFGKNLLDALLISLPQLTGLKRFGGAIRFLLSCLLLTILFAAIYAFVPGEKRKYTRQLRGAFFSAAVWNLFSNGFSLYFRGERQVSFYGSLSLVVIVMLWMYGCVYIVLIGAYVNQHSRRRSASC